MQEIRVPPSLFLRVLVVAITVTAMVGMPRFTAAHSFHYRRPDGKVVFTGKPLELPYRLERRLSQRWNGEEAQENLGQASRVRDQAVEQEDGDLGSFAIPGKYAAIVDKKGKKYKVSPPLIHAVIEAESGYHPAAVSHAGAVGLMQLMPATADRFGITDPTDPAQNIDAGTRYLRFLLDFFGDDLRLALAGYNAGEGAVLEYGHQIPPYPETRDYVARVLRIFQRNLDAEPPHSSLPAIARFRREGRK
jgi:hypothetical protein